MQTVQDWGALDEHMAETVRAGGHNIVLAVTALSQIAPRLRQEISFNGSN